MKNKIFLFLFAAAFLLAAAFSYYFFSNQHYRQTFKIDPFENVTISFSGYEGSGKAKVDNYQIEYSGDDDSLINLFKNINYRVSPKKNLSNGDIVTVYATADNQLLSLANAEFINKEKSFEVTGLIDSDKILGTESLVDEENNSIDDKEYFIIEGIKIPVGWNLSDEEIQDYINYKKELDGHESSPISSNVIEEDWIQGESEMTTNRKNSKFLLESYLNNGITTYKQAYEYGLSSSQLFKIIPLIENEETVGYECIFDGEDDGSGS